MMRPGVWKICIVRVSISAMFFVLLSSSYHPPIFTASLITHFIFSEHLVQLLAKYGTREQQNRWLVPLLEVF